MDKKAKATDASPSHCSGPVGPGRDLTDIVGRLDQGLLGEMRVTLRRRQLSMAEQLADLVKRMAAVGEQAGEGVTKIVKAKIGCQPGRLLDAHPNRAEALARLIRPARRWEEEPRAIHPEQGRQHRKRGVGQGKVARPSAL